jgi:hypothetical protein
MAVLLAEYRVTDVDAFRTVFREFGEVRRACGATGHRLLTDADDPLLVNVVIEFRSVGAARAFAADSRRAEALTRAGVVERADEVMEEMEAEDY